MGAIWTHFHARRPCDFAIIVPGGQDLKLLDEPSEGIQPSIVKEISRNIKCLNAETGLTVLFVEQNLDLIVNLAQRGFVIDKGRIIAEVGPDEIKDGEKVMVRTIAMSHQKGDWA